MSHPPDPEQVAIPEAAAALRALAAAVVDHRPASSGRITATPFAWVDPKTIPTRGALDMAALARDPIGTACRAEMRRIGERLAPHGREVMEAALIAAGGDEESGTKHRRRVIRSAWAGLPGWDIAIPAIPAIAA